MRCILCGNETSEPTGVCPPCVRRFDRPAEPATPPAPSGPEPPPASGLHRNGLLWLAAIFGGLWCYPPTRPLVPFFALMLVPALVCNFGFTLAGLACGAVIHEFRLGFGPTAAAFRLGQAVVSFGALAAGGSVKFEGHDDHPDVVAARGGEPGRFDSLPLLAKLLVMAAGPAAVLVLALALLGPREGWESFLRGFGQFIELLRGPRAFGRTYLVPFLARLRAGELVGPLGTCCAKMAAHNLLPFATMSGGMMINAVISSIVGPKRWRRPETILQFVGMFVLLAMFACMVFATITALRR